MTKIDTKINSEQSACARIGLPNVLFNIVSLKFISYYIILWINMSSNKIFEIDNTKKL